MEEIWMGIQGFDGQYQISNFGRVKSLAREVKGHGSNWLKQELILKNSVDKKGYGMVRLSLNNIKSTHKVHRLVAKAFIANPDNKPQINHIDCQKLNNSVSNLEWCNNSENQKHAFANGLNRTTINHITANKIRGLKSRRLSSDNVLDIKEMRKAGYTYAKIAEKYSISGKMAEQIIKGVKYKTVNI